MNSLPLISTGFRWATWQPGYLDLWIWFYERSKFVWRATFLIFCSLFYWSIVDLQCCVNFYCTAKWFSYTYIYIYIEIERHSFSHSSPLWFITGYGLQFPVPYSRILLYIHSIYCGLHLLTPDSHSVPTQPLLPLGNHQSVLYVSEPVPFSWLWIR